MSGTSCVWIRIKHQNWYSLCKRERQGEREIDRKMEEKENEKDRERMKEREIVHVGVDCLSLSATLSRPPEQISFPQAALL